MSSDPRMILEEASMSWTQIWAIAATIALNALDGFDVLAISFAAPGIAKDWQLAPTALGGVLSMELVGMAVGSVTIGRAADRFGRRPTVLSCLCVMFVGMLLTAWSATVLELAACRILTGIGIGGMLPALTALASEHSNGRKRSLSLSLMVIGYSAGAVIGGSVAALLLQSGNWRDIFLFGAAMTAIFLPIAWIAIPETVQYQLARPNVRTLDKVNRLMQRMKQAPIALLPKINATQKMSARHLFGPRLRASTLLAAAIYFGHILTFYFTMKWMTKLLVDAGQSPSDAAWMLVLTNVAGIAGGAIFGFAGQFIRLKTLSVGVFIASTASVSLFGAVLADPALLPLVVVAIGLSINCGVVACYAVLAQVFPTDLRATGSGLILGSGRFAAILAPLLAGQLLALSIPVAVVTLILSLGSIIAIFAIVPLRLAAPTTNRIAE